MHQALRRALATLAAVALTTSLAACSDDGNAAPEPTVGATATDTAKPSESSSPTPKLENPETFIRRFWAADRRMQATGEVQQYLALTRDCTTCESLADRVSSIYDAGGHINAPDVTVQKIVAEGERNGFHAFRATVVTGPTTYQESADGPTKSFRGGTVTYDMSLVPARNSWIVVLYTVER